MSNTNLISIEKIESVIYLIRSEKVMLDRDLARLYDVSTAALNQQCGAIASVFQRISCFS